MEEGREKERQEHEQMVAQAKKLQFEENCEEAREEVSKQLNKQILTIAKSRIWRQKRGEQIGTSSEQIFNLPNYTNKQLNFFFNEA